MRGCTGESQRSESRSERRLGGQQADRRESQLPPGRRDRDVSDAIAARGRDLGTLVPDIVVGVVGGGPGPELYTIDRHGPGRLSTMTRPPGFGALDHALAALRAAGVDVLVSLLAEDEAEEEGLAYEAERANAHGLTFYRLPTRDHHAPDRDATAALAQTLHGHLARGDSVVVHCWAGIGRSSTVAAATLLLEGYEPGAAWRLISAARGYEVPDQQSQRDLIDELWS